MKQSFKNILLIMTVLFSANIIAAGDPLSVLNDQVDAFNKRDVVRLVENVSDDFKYFFITADELVLESDGKAAFQIGMEQYFASRKAKIHSMIEYFTIDGNKISFKEVVSHKNKEGKEVTSSALGVYKVQGGKITRAWYFVE